MTDSHRLEDHPIVSRATWAASGELAYDHGREKAHSAEMPESRVFAKDASERVSRLLMLCARHRVDERSLPVTGPGSQGAGTNRACRTRWRGWGFVTRMNEASTSACACAAPRRGVARTKPRSASYGLALSVGLAALVPKCPMCLAAYLSLVGLGGGVAAYVHPVLRPLSLVLVTLALGALLFQRRRA